MYNIKYILKTRLKKVSQPICTRLYINCTNNILKSLPYTHNNDTLDRTDYTNRNFMNGNLKYKALLHIDR